MLFCFSVNLSCNIFLLCLSVMDSLGQLHDGSLTTKAPQAQTTEGGEEVTGNQSHPINQNVAMAIAGSSVFQRSSPSGDTLDPFQHVRILKMLLGKFFKRMNFGIHHLSILVIIILSCLSR